MTRQELILANQRLFNRYEKAFTPLVKRALKNQISSFTSVLKEQGPGAVSSVVVIDIEMHKVIETMYITAGLDKANDSLGKLKRLPKVEKKKRTFGFNAEWTREIIEYFKLHLFDKVVLPISQTTKEFIEQIIAIGTTQGWSIDRMVEECEREDYLNARTRRIVRTELNRAINFGGTLARDKFEYKTQKRWIAVHDNRTRHAHREADGQTVNDEDAFNVGGEQLDFPGDPNGSAGNTIHCRCFAEDVAVRDERGSLVPKEGQRQVRVRGRLRRDLQNILQDLTN